MKNIKKIFIFALLLLLSFMIFNQVFRRKLDEGDTWKIFYEQEKDSIDVIVLGSSYVFGSINPAILYQDYGIVSYVLGTPGMSIKAAYYTCVEVLKTQNPKVIIIGINGAHADELMDTINTPAWIGGMKLSRNKYNMARAISEDWISLFLEYPIIHNRYDGDLERRDFLPYRGEKYHEYYKGNRVFWNTYEEFTEEDFPYIEEIGELSDETKKYLDLLLALTEESDTEIIFYSSPFAQREDIQKTTNAIGQYAEERGIGFINLNALREEIGLNMSEDMADAQHVNYKGQEKTTAYIGNELREHYGMEDRRGDCAYESWEMYAEDYRSQYAAYTLANGFEEIHSYLSQISTGDYTVLINVQGVGIKETIRTDHVFAPFLTEYDESINNILVQEDGSVSLNLKENTHFDFGSHVVTMTEWSLMYDQIGIAFLENAVSFIVFDNKQESILEVRYYGYDEKADEWNMISKDCWFQEVWLKK